MSFEEDTNLTTKLRAVQNEKQAYYLGGLIVGCIERYIDAMYVLGFEGKTLSNLKKFIAEPFSVEPMLPVYSAACERFNKEFFPYQVDIWVDPSIEPVLSWDSFMRNSFIPCFWQKNISRFVVATTGQVPYISSQQALAFLLMRQFNRA